MTSQTSSPLVGTAPTRKGEPQVGDLLTVLMFKDGGFNLPVGARLERVACGTAFVKLVGLDVPPPYQIGERFPIPMERVIDWGA